MAHRLCSLTWSMVRLPSLSESATLQKACESAPTLFSTWFLFTHASFLHMRITDFLDDPLRLLTSAFPTSSLTFFHSIFLQNFFFNTFAPISERSLHLLQSSVSSHFSVRTNLSFNQLTIPSSSEASFQFLFFLLAAPSSLPILPLLTAFVKHGWHCVQI